MGLDQFAYVASKAPSHYPDTSKRQIAYWRKHPNLQGWMEKLWLEKGKPNGDSGQEESWGSGFNGVELELTWDDIHRLEQDIKSDKVSELGTVGFFFGTPSDDRYRNHDLEFCFNAKTELFMGFKVFYNSSW
jgi:hypothetical protein